MPHVSNRKLDAQTANEIEERLMMVLSSPGTKTRQELFRELLTGTEQVMLAKRLSLISLLIDGASIRSIHETLGISPSTIQRFDLALERGRFKKTKAWLTRNSEVHKALRALAEIVSRPYGSKSLHRLVDEEM